MDHAPLIELLPTEQRLALAYSPADARPAALGVLALDARLAGIVRAAREPMLGQLRLAWWRDRLAGDSAQWPAGEPLLALLRDLPAARLVPLVDGWEALLGDPLASDAVRQLVEGRARAWSAIGSAADPDLVAAAARQWALADLAGKLTDPELRRQLASLDAAGTDTSIPLPRAMRTLAVLAGLGRRARRRGEPEMLGGAGAFAAAVRLGLSGR